MAKRIINEIYTSTPKCPAYLSGKAREHWEDIIPRLVADHLVRPSDISTLGMACNFFSAYMDAVSKHDLNNAKKASEAYLKIMTKYGVSPEGRAKLKLGDRSDDDEDDDDSTGDLFSGFFNA